MESVVLARWPSEESVVRMLLAAARTTERAYITKVKARRVANAWKDSRESYVRCLCVVRKIAAMEVPVPGRGVASACQVLPETIVSTEVIPMASIPVHVTPPHGPRLK